MPMCLSPSGKIPIFPQKLENVYLLINLESSSDRSMVQGVEGTIVVPGQLGRVQGDVGLYRLVECVDQTFMSKNGMSMSMKTGIR
jgi:hypothetical protein